MKRAASSEPEGALQRLEKAVKEGVVEPEVARADSFLLFLQDLSAEDANEWHDVLLKHRVRSLEDLVGLADNERGWNKIVNEELNDNEPMLATKLLAWKLSLSKPSGDVSPPGNQWCERSLSLCFLFRSFVLAHPLLLL
jgi:hypothetical protein